MTTNPPIAVTAPAAIETAYRYMQAAVVCLSLIGMAGILHMGEAAYIAFALAGGFLVHMVAARPSRREALAAMACGAGFGITYILHQGRFGDFFGREIGITGGFLGMGSVMVLTAKWIWAPAVEKRARLAAVRDAGLIPLLCVGSMIAVGMAMQLTPTTYDRVLYAFDAKFGGPPSWVVGKMFLAHPWLLTLSGYAYNSLPLGMAGCLAMQWRDRSEGVAAGVDLRRVAVTLGVTGFLLYQVCPAAGPVYLFPKQFPNQVPDLAGFAIQRAWLQPVPRNGMPSLHVGWMLLLFWNVRKRAWWIAAVAAAYLMLTVLATLGLGEHYLSDLIAAVPLALAIQAACTRSNTTARWAALAIGGGIVLAWLIGLRSGTMLAIPAGGTVWGVATVTIAASVVGAAWLDHDSEKLTTSPWRAT